MVSSLEPFGSRSLPHPRRRRPVEPAVAACNVQRPRAIVSRCGSKEPEPCYGQGAEPQLSDDNRQNRRERQLGKRHIRKRLRKSALHTSASPAPTVGEVLTALWPPVVFEPLGPLFHPGRTRSPRRSKTSRRRSSCWGVRLQTDSEGAVPARHSTCFLSWRRIKGKPKAKGHIRLT